jgi:tetratricopeptide (TPR) repeat protein
LACVCLSAAAQDLDLASDLIQKGYLSIQREDAPGAISQFEDAVRLAPDDAQAWKQLSYLYLAANERPLALVAVERTLQLTPDDQQAATQRAFLLRSLGYDKLAATAFAAIAASGTAPFAEQAATARAQLDNQTDPAYGALDRAYIALAAGNFDRAIAGFREVLTLDPRRANIEKELAYALLRAGETRAARDAFERAIQLDPSDERAALELAFLQHETGQPAEALVGFRALSRSQVESIATLAGQTADSLGAELGAAIDRWVVALEQDPENRSVHLELGDFYEKRNQPVEAAEQYLAGWRLPGPDGDEVLLKLGHARMRTRDAEGAHGAWLLAAQSEETRIAETALALLPDRFPWAIEFLAALRINPDHVELRRELAYLYLEVELRQNAIAQFETILRIQSNDYQSAAQLAFIYQESGDVERAAGLLEQAEQSDDPEVAERARLQLRRYREDRSRSLREMGDKSLQQSYLLDAQKQFADAYSANPEDHAAALKLGVVHNLMKQDREAIEWFRIASESEDPQIAEQASRSYSNLAPQYRFAQTTVWMYPLYSRRFGTVFGYAQAKTEFRIGDSPIRPYVSVRLAGDVRGRAGASPALLSESSLIAAVGARVRVDHGITLWGEAGESFSYLRSTPVGVPRAAPDYRGGLNWARFRGASLGGDEAGIFTEANLDVVYVSRFNNDVLAYFQFRPGYRPPTRGPLRSQLYWNWNVTTDTSRDYWGNYFETGPGLKLRVPTVAPPMDLSVDFVRGVHLSNQGNLKRPNYWDLRVGVWYSFGL